MIEDNQPPFASVAYTEKQDLQNMHTQTDCKTKIELLQITEDIKNEVFDGVNSRLIIAKYCAQIAILREKHNCGRHL